MSVKPQQDTAKAKGSWLGAAFKVTLKLIWAALVIMVPLLGVWVASSLTAYRGGPVWLACVAGLLAFPIVPLLWDARAQWRWRKKEAQRQSEGKPPRERFMTFWDRLILRTLALNLVALTALLLTFPQEGFTALATRGDWMLEERQEPWAEDTRQVLFASAEGLEWLYDLTRDNPYEQFQPDDQPSPTPTPSPTKKASKDPKKGKKDKGKASKGEDKGKKETKDKGDKGPSKDADARQWPFEAKLHPIVTQMPPEAEVSPQAAAEYIAQKVTDPLMRVKALHDFVADRIAYDAAGLRDGSYVHKQDIDTIWKTRTAVCAGYSRLMVEMGKHTGDEILYITGVARDADGTVDGIGHAWNAVKIEGKWYLMDVTWDAGFIETDWSAGLVSEKFTKRYSTNYFLTRPDVFGLDHLPDDPRWQLRQEPLTRGAFMRQPLLRPKFYAQGFDLLSPERSQISASDKVTFVIDNPQDRFLMARIAARDSKTKGERCEVKQGEQIKIDCTIKAPGLWSVQFFSSKKQYSTYWSIGRIDVNGR